MILITDSVHHRAPFRLGMPCKFSRRTMALARTPLTRPVEDLPHHRRRNRVRLRNARLIRLTCNPGAPKFGGVVPVRNYAGPISLTGTGRHRVFSLADHIEAVTFTDPQIDQSDELYGFVPAVYNSQQIKLFPAGIKEGASELHVIQRLAPETAQVLDDEQIDLMCLKEIPQLEKVRPVQAPAAEPVFEHMDQLPALPGAFFRKHYSGAVGHQYSAPCVSIVMKYRRFCPATTAELFNRRL